MCNDPQFIISWYEWLILIENLTVSFVLSPLHICANFFNSKGMIFILVFGRGEKLKSRFKYGLNLLKMCFFVFNFFAGKQFLAFDVFYHYLSLNIFRNYM